VRRSASTSAMTWAPSVGVSSPCATASTTAPAAFAASYAPFTGGKSNCTGPCFRGATRSRHKRSAVASPSSASSTALRVRASASAVDKVPGGPRRLVTRALGASGVARGEASRSVAALTRPRAALPGSRARRRRLLGHREYPLKRDLRSIARLLCAAGDAVLVASLL
jgi:hypothetical protein